MYTNSTAFKLQTNPEVDAIVAGYSYTLNQSVRFINPTHRTILASKRVFSLSTSCIWFFYQLKLNQVIFLKTLNRILWQPPLMKCLASPPQPLLSVDSVWSIHPLQILLWGDESGRILASDWSDRNYTGLSLTKMSERTGQPWHKFFRASDLNIRNFNSGKMTKIIQGLNDWR